MNTYNQKDVYIDRKFKMETFVLDRCVKSSGCENISDWLSFGTLNCRYMNECHSKTACNHVNACSPVLLDLVDLVSCAPVFNLLYSRPHGRRSPGSIYHCCWRRPATQCMGSGPQFWGLNFANRCRKSGGGCCFTTAT